MLLNTGKMKKQFFRGVNLIQNDVNSFQLLFQLGEVIPF